MSDWIDLQLAHSLTPLKAPDALWDHICAPLPKPAPRRHEAFRWAAPCAVAACALLLLIRSTSLELRPAHPQFVSNDPVAVQHWMAHEAGIPVPLRPAPGVRVKGARVIRQGVVAVVYEVDGRTESVTISRGSGASPCKLPGHTVTLAANTASDAACKLCHSL